mmetsp:Transcript_23032/g.87075  ORF Transcript_23032/g.87075 Transcript_23032/m.87075 type:complete len:218 (+) Transcript_23032:2220-2873(+)
MRRAVRLRVDLLSKMSRSGVPTMGETSHMPAMQIRCVRSFTGPSSVGRSGACEGCPCRGGGADPARKVPPSADSCICCSCWERVAASSLSKLSTSAEPHLNWTEPSMVSRSERPPGPRLALGALKMSASSSSNTVMSRNRQNCSLPTLGPQYREPEPRPNHCASPSCAKDSLSAAQCVDALNSSLFHHEPSSSSSRSDSLAASTWRRNVAKSRWTSP